MHVQLFFDTCVLFSYLVPSELFHKDAIELIDVINNSNRYKIRGKVKEFRGYILQIVEDEFFYTMNNKITSILQDIHQTWKQQTKGSQSDFIAALKNLKLNNAKLCNFIEYIFQTFEIEKISNLIDFYKLISQIRLIIRKKYFQLLQFQKIQFKKINPQIQGSLNEQARTLHASRIDLNDRKIIIYADKLTIQKNPSHLLTTDIPIINQRMNILPQLSSHLTIINFPDFRWMYLGEAEHIEILNKPSDS